MRNIILLVSFVFFLKGSIVGQEDSITQTQVIENISTATLKTKAMSIDLANTEDVEFALKNIHKFRYLESLILDGEADENSLKKLIYRLSVLKNLTSLTFKENELKIMPENIANIRTLQSLTIEGNINLDYTDLFAKLKNVQLDQLNLIDNDLKKTPATISEITSLKKVQLTGSNQLEYTNFVDLLSKLPVLTTLSIPVNYMSELPKNIDKLKSLQVLDVSNNNLTELPQEISSLKAINNLSIQGNLLLNPAKDLEKLKGNNIKYLSLDKEISGEEIEQIKKMFPNAEIDFPISKGEDENENKKNNENKSVTTPAIYSGELKAKKELRILSAAYALYPALFQGLIYSFDTLNFAERYNDLRYENISQIVNNGRPRRRILYFRKTSISYEKSGKKNEIWFRFAYNDPLISASYPELRAFLGMLWMYKGDLSKKQFEKKYMYIKQRREGKNIFGGKRRKRKKTIQWNDIRVYLDKNNNLFSIQLKNDSGFSKFTAYPLITSLPIEGSQKTYTRRFDIYQKALFRRASRFKTDQRRAKSRYDVNFKRVEEFAWKDLQSRMSNEEKVMSKKEWLEYYDDIIANEQKLIDNTSLVPVFITRGLSLRGFSVPTTNTITTSVLPNDNSLKGYGLKAVNVDFVDSKSAGKLAVTTIMILDNKNKTITQVNGSLGLIPNFITLQQFSSYTILIELRNGNWGSVNSEEIDKQNFEPNKTYLLNTIVFDKNLDTIGDLLKSGVK